MTKVSQEETVQIKVSPRVEEGDFRSAFECDETVRTFILKALKDRGVTVSDEELVDWRKVSGR